MRMGLFENGYGVSVIEDGYGSEAAPYEVAVLHYGKLCYATPITNDVLGFQTGKQVDDIVKRVKKLPVNRYCTHGRRS